MTRETKDASAKPPRDSRSIVKWLALPRKNAFVLGFFAILYLVWLAALVWLAIQAQRSG